MIIFDRFLCCMNLKTFGKILGWLGTMVSFMLGYALFLIGSAKTANTSDFRDEYFGRKVSEKEISIAFATCALVAVIHILLICGIKYGKRLSILLYIFFPILATAGVLCLGPSIFDLPEWKYDEQGAIAIAICAAIILFIVYLTLCIYSLYEIVKAEEKRKKFYAQCENNRA